MFEQVAASLQALNKGAGLARLEACFLPKNLCGAMQSFIASRSEQKGSVPGESVLSLAQDFKELAKDFKHLKVSSEYGRDLNRAFQRLIYLLTDQKRVQAMASSQWAGQAHTLEKCLGQASAYLTERQ